MDYLFIFGAKYLILLSPVVTAWYLLTAHPEIRRKVVIFLLISLPLAYLVGLGARSLYFNPRPFVVEEFEPLIKHSPDNGFPSDHLLLAGTLAAGMLFFNRRYAWLLWGIAALVAVSRIYAGMHHFLDIVASIVIALTCAILVKTFYARE